MDRTNIYQAVNDYLANWDPINLPNEIAKVEYVSYVPDIIEALLDKHKLCSCLMAFFESLGISQENVNVNLRDEAGSRADELMKLEGSDYSHEVFLLISDNDSRNGVRSWYVTCDDLKDCVCREVGIDESGSIVVKFEKRGPHAHLTVKELIQGYYTEIISKEEFELIWNKS